MRWLWIPLTLLAAVIAWLGSGVALAAGLVLLGLFIRFTQWMRRFRVWTQIGVYVVLAFLALVIALYLSQLSYQALRPPQQVPAQYSAASELAASRREITLRTTEEIIVPHMPVVELPDWQSAEATDSWRLARVRPPLRWPVDMASAVTVVRLALPTVKWRGAMGEQQLVFDSAHIRLRAPHDTVWATTPAASPPKPITGDRVDYTIDAQHGDATVEIEVLHPLLRNAFGVWIRGLSIATAAKWLAGIILGLLASGLGGWLKRLVSRKPEKPRQAGFKPAGG